MSCGACDVEPHSSTIQSTRRTDNSLLIPPIKMKIRTLILAVAAIVNSAVGQDYQDYADGYEQDNLYENYAAKQQEKVDGGGG